MTKGTSDAAWRNPQSGFRQCPLVDVSKQPMEGLVSREGPTRKVRIALDAAKGVATAASEC